MTKARDIASASPAPSTVSATELGYLDGVSSAIQTQLNNKQAVVANVNDTEIGYLDGVTSAIQTQIDGKSSTSHNHDSTYVAKSLVDAKGDLLVGSANDTVSRLAVASTAGYVLTVDSAEATGVKWAAAAGGSLTPYCSVNANATNITDNVATEVVFSNENFDSDNAYNTSTGRFTPQTAGKYFVTASIPLNANTASIWHTGQVSLRKNGSEFARNDADFYISYAPYNLPITISGIIDCNGTTDYISVFVTLNVTSGGTPQYAAASRMVIYRIGA